jgi:hypothetical protein
MPPSPSASLGENGWTDSMAEPSAAPIGTSWRMLAQDIGACWPRTKDGA